ncbi:hypothetical protein KAFR_0D01490 [Kazachstania africana CBS 2517]|uniref:RGS domain-containing protein n=1 Tax=Kazachstania africana (strain ATCC 22294 / BCRC 22015 / CBS 2517 / CECT 1963 / NBRC 1671 / NRRL Y-8276) TaxID=1071382 RepID=H2ATU5_KAZAF|nr:hypothetical protein KAFR_0D01490 [Kazachstania africana CBS 2517]CCF57795.1 hypothetical protein KAFR_0D01490 [Kazachstania africana CBS 2517]
MELDFAKIQEERLPTLYEVLIQKTSVPVDLWSFYTYLSQFPYAINYLDFWIDLMAHLRLSKDYINGIRGSLLEESNFNELENQQSSQEDQNSNSENVSVTTSVLLNALMEEGHLDFENPDRVSKFLQGKADYSPKLSQLLDGWKRHSGIYDANNNLNIDNGNLPTLLDEMLKNKSKRNETSQITTKQLLNNALQICNTYLYSTEKSAKYLSNISEETRMKVLDSVVNQNRYDPEVFEELKATTYQLLETDCFPKFLSTVALHNIHDELSDWRFHSEKGAIDNTTLRYRGSRSPFSNHTTLSRLIFGLVWLGIGFWIGYVLIFLKYSRAIRVVTVVPFAIGCYLIICGMYQVDIIYSWFGVTQVLTYKDSDSKILRSNDEEHTTTKEKVPFLIALLGGGKRTVKIEHTFIKKLLQRRGLWCLLLVVISTAIFTVIFSCVPGFRI